MPVPTHTPVPVAAPAATLPAGTVLRNRYVLEAMLGRGRRSTVYRALDRERSKLPQASQHVALKILHASAIGDASALAALRVEFQCAQSLSHPNIVNVFELEQDGPLTFMTMELLDGDTLGSLLERYQRQPLPRPLALAIIRDVGAALVHAHERGVVHGSLHPRHIMITANGEVRVTNFAAARLGPGDQAPETHAYASCEALQGQVADRRDDLYALACISYELLAGHHPFNRLTAAQARGRALVPRRPLRLGRRPWRSLRAGLAWRRENRTLGIGWWLGRMNLGAAAARLPSLRELMSPPPPARSNLVRPAVLAACLGATIVVAARLDRLPSSEHLSQGWHELRAVAQGNPLRRLGDWMSPSVTTTSTAGRRAPDSTRHAAAGGNQRRGRIVSKDPATPAPVADAPAAGASAVDAQPVDAQPAPGQAAAESTNTLVSSERSSSTTADSPLRLAASKAPPMHLEFSTDNYTVLPGEPAARVEVRRRGNLLGDVSFVWSTEAASAQPERDFVASGPRAEQIPAGTSSVTLLVPIISDAARSESRVFYVTIAEPGGGAELGANTRASVLVAGGN